jgi:peptidoglycan/xylan/chitin deacetylase (PgdA/CDA1 family)
MRAICLHAVKPDVTPRSLSAFDTTPRELDQLIESLQGASYRIVPPSAALERRTREDTHAVTLTFDDGLRSSFGWAMAAMREHGISIGLAPITSLVTGNGSVSQTVDYVCAAELAQWLGTGGELIAHTHTHPRLSQLGPDELVRELEADLAFYDSHDLPPPCLFAYPYGELNPCVRSEVSQRYRAAYATGGGVIDRHADFYTLSRKTVRRDTIESLLALDWNALDGHA